MTAWSTVSKLIAVQTSNQKLRFFVLSVFEFEGSDLSLVGDTVCLAKSNDKKMPDQRWPERWSIVLMKKNFADEKWLSRALDLLMIIG